MGFNFKMPNIPKVNLPSMPKVQDVSGMIKSKVSSIDLSAIKDSNIGQMVNSKIEEVKGKVDINSIISNSGINLDDYTNPDKLMSQMPEITDFSDFNQFEDIGNFSMNLTDF